MNTAHQLNELISVLEDAASKWPEIGFEYDQINRKCEFSGEPNAIIAFTSIAASGIRFIPRQYLAGLRPFNPNWTAAALWCLGAISTFWRIGIGKPGLQSVLVTLDDGKQFYQHLPNRLGPFEFQDDPSLTIAAQQEKHGWKIQQIEIHNNISCYRDSIHAAELLLCRYSLADDIDNCVPTYVDAIRLAADIDDLVAAAEKCGTDHCEDAALSGGIWALYGGIIPLRFRLWNTTEKFDSFQPNVTGWSYRAQSAMSQVMDTLRDYFHAINYTYCSPTPVVIDYSTFPRVPQKILDRFKRINCDLKQELQRIAEGTRYIPNVPDFLTHSDANRDERILTQFFIPERQESTVTTGHVGQKHDVLCEYLISQIEQLEFSTRPRIDMNQCLADSGVDILIAIGEVKYGVQVKSHLDISQQDFRSKLYSQIENSRRHGLRKLWIILAGDMTSRSQSEKVRGFMSEVSQQNDPYKEVVEPEKAWTVFFRRVEAKLDC